MKKMGKLFAWMLASSLLCTNTFAAVATSSTSTPVFTETQQKFLEAIDTEYALNITRTLTTFGTNEDLGYRNAGSTAELAAADMLYNAFKEIGLQDVRKDGSTVDSWEFTTAKLTYTHPESEMQEVVLGGYPTQYVTDGVESFEIVYAGDGTKFDFENLDVEGKLVLVDIDQRANWWINYPAYEAYLNGAEAIIANNVSGYGELDPSAVNSQDMCGPEYTPAFSISPQDAEILKGAIATAPNGVLEVGFEADSVITKDATSYNVVGHIPGKNPEQLIFLSGHYDAYFYGFQDDSAAIGMAMALAKAVIDSGYQPEKTIVVIAHGAEEWGVVNSRYDWSTGAYNQVFSTTPEWQDMGFAMLNFEGAGYEHTTEHEIISGYEYKNFLQDFVDELPQVPGIYEDGITVNAPLGSWSDDFSYSLAGIPSLRNGYNGSEYSASIYHTQLDTEETFNPDAYAFNHYLYGMLLLEMDAQPILPLDFTTRFEAMASKINEEVFETSNIDVKAYEKAIKDVIQAAKKLNNKLEAFEPSKNPTTTEFVNDKLKDIFRYCEDEFLNLTWEDSYLFPYEYAQRNILSLQESIALLEAGDLETAYNESLGGVDNNWYAYDFSKETMKFFTEQVTNQPDDRLKWGAGRVQGHVDLYDVIESVHIKLETGETDVTEELAVLKEALESQYDLLETVVNAQFEKLHYVEALLNSVLH